MFVINIITIGKNLQSILCFFVSEVIGIQERSSSNEVLVVFDDTALLDNVSILYLGPLENIRHSYIASKK